MLLCFACDGSAPKITKFLTRSSTRDDPRTIRTINRDWTFNYLPSPELKEDPAAPGFNDARWNAVALPHTWSTFETTRELHPFIRNASERDDPYWWHGWGWYRKRFTLQPGLAGKKIFIEFDGVQKYSRIYLNGQFIGEHKGGFTSFYFDLTGRAIPGQENILAVAVSNRRDDDFGHIPPMTAGNWNTYGGIYRDVRLVIKNPLYIPFQGSADHEGGTFISTPEISERRAIVRVLTWVKNDYDHPMQFTLVSTIFDPAGQTVQRLEKAFALDAGKLNDFDQSSDPILNPRLWSPEEPNVYKVVSQIYMDGQLVDTCESPLGFRWFHWNHDEDRLYLNGRRIHLHGTNRHQEYPWLGDAIPLWMHVVDHRDIRNIGFNFMRTAHYPQDPLVYDLADRLGIIVIEEVPNIKKIDYGEDVQEQNLREMIRRDRNHPSILMWSMGNETTDAADSAWAVDEDKTRLIYARHVENNTAGKQVDITDENIEMENLLRCTIRGWYSTDEKNLEPKELQHAGTMSWHHATNMLPDNVHQKMVDVNGGTWLYADHGADREYKNCPLKHLNPKGWVDAYRIPKYTYYQWQANYTSLPMVFIHPHYWRRQYLGQQRDFVVDSNCDQVELRVNGRVVGQLYPAQTPFHCVTFKNIMVKHGTLEAIGKKGDLLVKQMLPLPGSPAKITLSSGQQKITADRAGIAVIKADIADEHGVPVLGANNDLHWEVSGPATLVGPERYQSDRDRTEEMDGAMYFDAPVCNVIRSTTQPGRIIVRVSSPGLQPAELELQAVAPLRAPDDDIVEPALSDDGRQAVTINPHAAAITNNIAGSIQLVYGELRFGGAPDTWRDQLDQQLRAENPQVDHASGAYALMLDLFAVSLQKNKGVLIADDFNFIANNYNEYLKLTRAIDQTSLDASRKESLKKSYAETIVHDGQRLDIAAEIKRLEQVKQP